MLPALVSPERVAGACVCVVHAGCGSLGVRTTAVAERMRGPVARAVVVTTRYQTAPWTPLTQDAPSGAFAPRRRVACPGIRRGSTQRSCRCGTWTGAADPPQGQRHQVDTCAGGTR